VGEKITHVIGWESGFVGTIFMALATTLPEVAVTISAIKMKAVEMAFSNVLGINLFNIIILGIVDFAYSKGPLLSDAEPAHIITVFTALLMTGVVTTTLIIPPKKRILNAYVI
jgi:cation:H+ antiporter